MVGADAGRRFIASACLKRASLYSAHSGRDRCPQCSDAVLSVAARHLTPPGTHSSDRLVLYQPNNAHAAALGRGDS